MHVRCMGDREVQLVLVAFLGYLLGTAVVGAVRGFIRDAAAEGVRHARPHPLEVAPK